MTHPSGGAALHANRTKDAVRELWSTESQAGPKRTGVSHGGVTIARAARKPYVWRPRRRRRRRGRHTGPAAAAWMPSNGTTTAVSPRASSAPPDGSRARHTRKLRSSAAKLPHSRWSSTTVTLLGLTSRHRTPPWSGSAITASRMAGTTVLRFGRLRPAKVGSRTVDRP